MYKSKNKKGKLKREFYREKKMKTILTEFYSEIFKGIFQRGRD